MGDKVSISTEGKIIKIINHICDMDCEKFFVDGKINDNCDECGKEKAKKITAITDKPHNLELAKLVIIIEEVIKTSEPVPITGGLLVKSPKAWQALIEIWQHYKAEGF